MQEEDSAALGNVEKEHFLWLTCHNFACGSGDQGQEGMINIRSLEPFPGEARMSTWAVWELSGPREAVSWDVCGTGKLFTDTRWLQNLLALNSVVWVYHQGNSHALNSYYLCWKQMLNYGLENRTPSSHLKDWYPHMKWRLGKASSPEPVKFTVRPCHLNKILSSTSHFSFFSSIPSYLIKSTVISFGIITIMLNCLFIIINHS